MKTGIVFEGGGMRGVFAAGVIDYLLDNGIAFDNVIGVSAGVCHACSYVCGQRGRAYAVNTDYLDDPDYCSLHSLRTTGDMFNVQLIYHDIPEKYYPIDNEYFKKSGVTLQAVVTNCVTGQAEYPVIHDMKDDIEYVHASSSLPMLAKMVSIDGNVYMDGGISDSIPVRELERQGCDRIVVVLTRPSGYEKKSNPLTRAIRVKYWRYPKMLKALKNRAHVYNETLDHIIELQAEGKCFVIAPIGDLGIGRTETNKSKLHRAYLEGYYIAEALGERMKRFMEE